MTRRRQPWSPFYVNVWDKPKKRGDMQFAHAKPAWVFPRLAVFEVGASDETVEVYGTARFKGVPADTGWRPGLWTGTTEKGPRAGWHCGVWWDVEGKQHAFLLPPDHVDLQPKPPTLAKPERSP